MAKRAGAVSAGTKAPETIAPARRAAFKVLTAVEAGRGHSDELLHASGPGAALHGLSELDRHLATALVLGVLRWQIALDAELQGMFSRPDTVVPAPVMLALRLGAFQLQHMDRIPAHAALSESVALTRATGHEHATGMVNAVLRRIAAAGALPAAKIFETPGDLARRLAHPQWLVARWMQRFGAQAARRICEADQHQPGKGVWFREHAAGDSGLPMIDDGSRLVAEIAVTAAPETVRPNELRVWDCCAAPGGKTAVLAARLPEAKVLATDISLRRLRSMEERLAGLAASAGEGGRVRCMHADARSLPRMEGDFDLVLCDVPCSGTGTLRRNPEIRLRLDELEIARQAERQRALLAAVAERIAPGGRLVYATCSLEAEECEQVVAAVLAAKGDGWRRVPVDGLLEQIGTAQGLVQRPENVVRDGQLRTLPGVHPADGFFAAVLEREGPGSPASE